MAKEKILRLVLGDQLNYRHSWYRHPSKDVVYVMMEVRQETDYVKHHIQKIAGFFAAMRQFAAYLVARGHRVIYLQLDDPENHQSIEKNLLQLVDREAATRFEYQLPDEFRLDRQLERIAGRLPVPVVAVDTEHFLTRRHDLEAHFKGKKRYFMESFYRHMRRSHRILMENDKPVGGKWNFDQSNRNRYDGAVPLPRAKRFRNDVSDIVAMIEGCGVKTFGRIRPERFVWPLNRQQARDLMREFVRKRLPYFGTYQDAMVQGNWSLFHSRLSFALNTKMLHPMEVIQAAIDRAREPSEPDIEIAQLEGFVRQILGWREYVRGIYWAQMPAYETLNHFNHQTPLPDYYWTAETGMTCMRAAIDQSLEHAYAHHIQRLMVTGNFALLAGVHPDAVDDWYLGIYIDAIQWVEIINTRGMSQFADGGIVATKPYISSANYIHKMSDYCQGCRYDHRKRTGEKACPFNSFYWDFLNRHRPLLENNPRISVMYRTWDRMKDDNRRDLMAQAAHYRANLNRL